MNTESKRIVVGITGASGAPYAQRLLDCLEAADVDVHLVVSALGRRLLADELGVKHITPSALIGRPTENITVYPIQDVGSRLASGSFPTDGMVVCPCSSNTLGAIAAGISDNLITRAAQVTLKERRRLILLHREMPVSRIELGNMLRVTEAGAIVCPAAPGFYLLPKRIEDLVNFIVGKLLDLLEVEHDLNVRWAEHQAKLKAVRQSTGT